MGCYEKFHGNKLYSLDEMYNFCVRHITKVHSGRSGQLNRPICITEFKLVVKNYRPYGLTGEFYQTIKDLHPQIHKEV